MLIVCGWRVFVSACIRLGLCVRPPLSLLPRNLSSQFILSAHSLAHSLTHPPTHLRIPHRNATDLFNATARWWDDHIGEAMFNLNSATDFFLGISAKEYAKLHNEYARELDSLFWG